MNISSSCVAASTLLLRWPRTKVETAAEIPAASPLTSRTGRMTALFTRLADLLDLFDRGADGLIDLVDAVASHLARVMQQFADPFHLFAAGAHNRRRLPWTCPSDRAGRRA